MVKWTFEPGHTAADFKVRHMMVTWVRGSFRPIEGSIFFDPEHLGESTVDVTIDANTLWSGEKDRDNHLKAEDFLFVEQHPHITFKGKTSRVTGPNHFEVTGDLTIRGVTKQATMDVEYLGSWQTPFWVGNEDKGPKQRAGFTASLAINRHDFGVSWNGSMDKGGIVVGDTVYITLDAEAIKEN